jgi:transcriptional regulator with XRE-family HTH domain
MATQLDLADLGRRVRAARLARGLTLEEVVAEVDLTVSWLSKIENGLLQPSLEALVKLADALGCGVDHLLAGVSVRPRHAVARRAVAAATGDGAAMHALLGRWPNRAMLPEVIHLAAAHRGHGPSQHDGERLLLVLDGRMRVEYGTEQIDLEAGDCMYLDASTPHTLRSEAATARVLSVSSARAGALSPPLRRRRVSRRTGPRVSAGRAAKTRGPASGRT